MKQSLELSVLQDFLVNKKSIKSIAKKYELTEEKVKSYIGKRYMDNTSKGHSKINEALRELYPQLTIENEKYIEGVYIDVYLPTLRLAIEYDGEYHYNHKSWHGDTFLYQNQQDVKKDNICKEHNIALIRIPYTDLKKINKEYVSDKIISKLGEINRNANKS